MGGVLNTIIYLESWLNHCTIWCGPGVMFHTGYHQHVASISAIIRNKWSV